MHGTAHRLPPRAGLLRYQVQPVAIRLGERTLLPVSVQQYQAADPDPLRHDAHTVLHHLSTKHADDLTACLRARGHTTLWCQPRALDRHGLDVLSVTPDGVEMIRLAFPAPVTRLQDLSARFAVPLLCRCSRSPNAGTAT